MVNFDSKNILGVKLNVVTYDKVEQKILHWSKNQAKGYICAANVHMVMEAYDDKNYRQIVNDAAIVTPDGMPLVWALKLLGFKDATRVYGPSLTLRICEEAQANSIPVGFYGSSREVLDRCVERIRKSYPGIQVNYAYSPPFRALTVEEENTIQNEIMESGVRILFVGLGCPKQERWMAEHVQKIPVIMLGVGAAFDFIAETKLQAPRWMQNNGLEWMFRLLTEPKRLWKRYAVHNPRFVFLFALQYLRYLFNHKE